MRVFICGIDGYIGWPLANYLLYKGHSVGGLDNQSRRNIIESIIPILPCHKRFGNACFKLDMKYYRELDNALRIFKPDCIVHLGENPSAPYSMRDPITCLNVQYNNVIGTLNLLWAMKASCPNAHLVKLGSMGEYGTPNYVIPEDFHVTKQPGSFYHASKVCDSANIEMACRIWGLRSTDIMQGVVYGTRIGINLPSSTRFDVDECFGTVINRFCAQALIGMPLTVYGKGEQQRGFLPLRDSIQCLTLTIENPPEEGEYRVFNQFAMTYSINELAKAVQFIYPSAKIAHLDNPRVEAEEHFYQPIHRKLFSLGYKPTKSLYAELELILKDLESYKNQIEYARKSIEPKIKWK